MLLLPLNVYTVLHNTNISSIVEYGIKCMEERKKKKKEIH